VWLSEKEGVKSHLPSEAQWEYACRAGTATTWYSGYNQGALKEHAWIGFNSGRRSHPVGQKSPNAWGLYDMHGNVWEWCQDWWGDRYYATSPMDDPPGAPGGWHRAFRGGGRECAGYPARASYRHACEPGNSSPIRGFRVARIVSLPSKVRQGPKKNADGPTPKLTTTTPKPTGPAPPPAVAPFDAKKAKEHQEAGTK
jgi:formylglycine-generating enzyme required for sulfatase activity